MPIYRGGGVIGRRVVPSVNSASGIWQLTEAEAARRDQLWPTLGDAFWSSVSLLLRFDGSDGATTFTDVSPTPKAMTANGNAQISTAQSKFGGASVYFDGTGDYLSTPSNSAFAFGTGDFTVETWLYVTSYNSQGVRFFTTSGLSTNFSCEVTSAGALGFWNGSAFTTFGSSGTVSTGAWHHVAICRASGIVRAFFNGNQVGNSAAISTNLANTLPIQFPATANYSSAICYLDELRVTKAARYTGAFPVPTTQFPGEA